MPTNLQTILTFLQEKGMPAFQAAGVAGNLQVESGLDPTRQNPAEGAVGLAQWEGDRRTGPNGLDAFAAATGGSETDLTTQLNFLWSELQGPESGAYQRLSATTNAGDAAAVFDQYFERSSGSARTQRVEAATAIAGGADTSPTSSASSSGGGGLFGGWKKDLFAIGLKVTAAAAAAGLVIVGAVNTVSK